MSKYVRYEDVAYMALQSMSILNGEWANAMQGLSTIDIVRCSECRYWHGGECWGIPYRGDYDTSIDTKADDFCSYGEREGE